MKIAHLCLGNFFVENFSYQENLLTKYHVQMGYEVVVIASLESYDHDGNHIYLKGKFDYVNEFGVRVIRLEYSNNLFFCLNQRLRIYKGLSEILAQISPDIIFSHNLSFYDLYKVKNYLNKNREVKFFCDNHADYYNSARNWVSKFILHKIIYRLQVKKIIPFVDKAFGVTPMRCEFLIDMYGLPRNRVELLPLGVDDKDLVIDSEVVRAKVCSKLGIDQGSFIISTGGKIDRKKNLDLLFEAFLGINVGPVELVIFGSISEELSEEYLSVVNSHKNIHWMGWLNSEEVMDILSASNLACFPGTHSTLWEQSIGLGVPLVVKHWKGIDHVNFNGNLIFYMNGGALELQEILSRLIFTKEYYNMKRKAYNASSFFKYSDISKRAIGLN